MVSVWPQWWQPVGGPRDKIWDLVALVWPNSKSGDYHLFSSGPGTSSVVPVLVSQDRDLCHVQLHPTWFEPISECSWPVVSYLYSGHLPMGLYLGRGNDTCTSKLRTLIEHLRVESGLMSKQLAQVFQLPQEKDKTVRVSRGNAIVLTSEEISHKIKEKENSWIEKSA